MIEISMSVVRLVSVSLFEKFQFWFFLGKHIAVV